MEKRFIYADNAATTKVAPEVLEVMLPYLQNQYGNPSSIYKLGRDAQRDVEFARGQVAAALGAQPNEIFFTSCGSESDNWAIKGYMERAAKRGKKHLITSVFEHHAVLHTCQDLEKKGFTVTYLPVGTDGLVNPQDVRDAIREDTAMVTIMYANNEIGTVEPIEEIGQIVKQFNPEIVYHVDAIQAYGKFKIVPKKLNIDLLSVSGHKIHGPKGTGFLYVKEKTKIKPIILGGGQQKAMRSGTENVPGIAGLGVAAGLIYNSAFDEKIQKMYDLRSYFIEELQKLPDVTINGCMGRESAPHIVSASFAGVRSEVLLHALEDKGIYVSAGSACSAHKPQPSATLQAMGIHGDQLGSTIRFSFSVENTMEEVDYTLQTLYDIIPVLRKFTRK